MATTEKMCNAHTVTHTKGMLQAKKGKLHT